MIFSTDLDRTLIFSKRRFDPKKVQTVPVEQREGVDCSFMTPRAYYYFQEIMRRTVLVANTMRGIEQAKRIRFVQEGRCDYVVTQNGLYIYRDDRPDKLYGEIVAALAAQTQFGFDEAIDQILHEVGGILCMSKRYEYMAVFFTDGERFDRRAYQQLRMYYHDCGWELYEQGKKLYLSPLAVDKSRALLYIREREQADSVTSFGDSYFDIPMLKASDIRYSLAGCELQEIHPDFEIHYSDSPGILGSQEVMEHFLNHHLQYKTEKENRR
ncbi:hypothetical protein [Candidatus Soleaferrea massiliensis]|uniref:hypothetical protein n=1 Tax=Candidatus Soleaferrea massiliensis TaxID=1470354 RepID=UPI00058C5BBE|nr:hypothetical protein [Candidatus Soleaferrea massiliensis]